MKILFFIVFILIYSCNDTKNHELSIDEIDSAQFVVSDFVGINNFLADNDSIVSLWLDYTNAIDSGFVIPSQHNSDVKYFVFSFNIKNNGSKAAKYFYKLYYQNETYKFDEEINYGGGYNQLSDENFYGSWDDSAKVFATTYEIPNDDKFHTVVDSFRIVGNPRFDLRYYDNGINQRWKRNPRVGVYSFLLTVGIDEKNVKSSIPEFISNITLKNNGNYVNPYYFYVYGEGSSLKSIKKIKSDVRLKIAAKPDPMKGIYIQPFNFSGDRFNNSYTDVCNQDTITYRNAAFEQFINNQDPSMRFNNIPVVRDVMSDDYTYTDYNWDMAFYTNNETISTLPGVARKPCETVEVNTKAGSIILTNPGCKQGEWRKESVGIRTRHGFTYGKYRLKCKLTELLNSNNVWNGITNAIWLLNQQYGGEWNNRRVCSNGGYMASYWGGESDKRVPAVDYSEIDFEILKTPPYCPPQNFPPVIPIPSTDKLNRDTWDLSYPEDLKGSEELIIVACTNWDMACWDPVNFNSGCHEIKYHERDYSSHRWTKDYRALTQKKYESDDELFGTDFYYFEIDWRPTEIIWRIGKDIDKMRVVGYMNDEITMIPNNQMTLIITQEYHNTKWWPGSPFIQENIPFPSESLIGEIFEIVIE